MYTATYTIVDMDKSLFKVTHGVIGEWKRLQLCERGEGAHGRDIVVVEDECLEVGELLQLLYITNYSNNKVRLERMKICRKRH